MTAKPSTIKCPKCGYQPNILSDVCLQCGAKLEKLCGDCGFANAVEKNYCDQCGAVLALQPPPKDAARQPEPAAPEAEKFKLEMESIQDTVSERDTSFRRRAEQPSAAVPPQAQPPAAPPHAAPAKPPAKVTTLLSPDSERLPKQTPAPGAPRPSMLKKLVGPLITLFLLGVLGVILYMIAAPSLPRLRLQMTAKAYLSHISQGRYEKAYALLSSNSKAACTIEEYVKNSEEYYSKVPAWQFKDVEVFAMADGAAMVRYQLKEEGGEWKSDFISFVREHNRWTRPYIWTLFAPIDDAMGRSDFPQALFLAQKLYLTDPIDPRSSAYLCEAEFFMNLHEKSAESCKRTIEMAEKYPARYVSDNLFQYHSYYADSLRYLQRDRVALAEYEKLLKWPGLTPDQACPLHLNRSDSYIYLKEHDKALQEILAASAPCVKSPAKEEVAKRLRFMSGSAGADAVAFVQRSRFQKGMPPLGEARKQQLEALKARLGPRNARLLPKDQWLAVHTAGPEYRVFLREEAYNPQARKTETRDIFIFLVNLWTNSAKVEKAPTPPPPPGAPPQEPGK